MFFCQFFGTFAITACQSETINATFQSHVCLPQTLGNYGLTEGMMSNYYFQMRTLFHFDLYVFLHQCASLKVILHGYATA